MEDWEKKIILQNMDKLIETTKCNSILLAKLLAHEILSVSDVDELMVEKLNALRAFRLYKMLFTRHQGFKTLLQALDETKQTGALSILTRETTTEYMISFTYHVKAVIGGDNETMVYKGRFGNRDVAVKKLLLEVIDAETVSHEIEILKNCEHQNIVRYFGSKKTPSSILILLELCDTNLSEWVKHKSVDILPMEVLRQATLGLEWLHSKRIVHRNLKPENVLLSRNASQVKISDFVLSKSILGKKSYESSSLKFGWIAPETFSQLIDQKHRKPNFTFASDVFSLGCLYYYVITDGKHPFGDIFSRQSNILDEKMLIDLKQVLHCCVQNTLFVRLMLSKDPNSRPSCSQLLASPLFWSDDRRIQFLECVFKSKQISIQMRTFLHSKWNAACAIDHSKEIELLRKLGAKKEYKLGCVVPVIYLQLIDVKEDFEQFFSSPHGFDTSEVFKLMNNDGKQLFENVRDFEDGSGARKFTRYLTTTFQKLKKAVVEKVGDGGLSDIEVGDNGLSNKTEVFDKPALEYAAEEPTGISNYSSTSFVTDDQWSEIKPVIIVESLCLMDDDISGKLVRKTDSSASSSKQKSNVQLEMVKAIVAEKQTRIIVQNEQSVIEEKPNAAHVKEEPAINPDNKYATNAENIISSHSAESSKDIPTKKSDTPIYETETKTNLKVAQPEETVNLLEDIESPMDETEQHEEETELPFEASIQLQMTSNANLDGHAMLEFWNSIDKILIICTVAPTVTQNRIAETWRMPFLELKTGQQFAPDHSMNHEELTVAHVDDPEKFLQNCRKDKGKFVLLTKVSYTFLVQKLGHQTDLKILKDVINWTDLSATYKEELLTSCSLLRHVDGVTIEKVLSNDIIFQLLEDPCTQLLKSLVPAQIACYIPRKIVRRDTQSENLLLNQNEHTEEEFLRTLGKHTSDQARLPVYISGTAGIGKSIFLGYIGRRLLNDNKIVIFLSVRDFMAYMKTIDKTSHLSHVVVESLCEMASCNSTGKSILAKLFECMCPFELMFDGLDEISSVDLKIFYDCLRVLTKTYIVRLWITTRSHLLHDIKNQLDGIVYLLSPFDLHDQRNLLIAVWQQELLNVSYDESKLGSFSNTCLSELVTVLGSDKNIMSCIPFFCYHIAKFYQKEAISYVTLQTKNISSPSKKYKFIANLFEYILSAIFAIYFERYNVSESEIIIDSVLSSHAIKSLALLFPEWVPRLKIYFEHNEILEDSEIYKIGILEPDCSNAVPQFIFAGLAEYFIAYFTTTLLVKDSCSKTSVQFLIHEILNTKIFHCEIFGRHSDYYHTKVAARFSHKSICYFLDNIISTGFQIKNLVEVLGTKKNLISQLSLACVYHDCFRLFQILSNTAAFWFYQTKILDDNFLFVLVRFGRLPLIDFILEKFEDFSEIHPHTVEISDDPVYLNLLHVAAYRGDYQIFNLLLKQYKFEDYVSKSKHTVLMHICAGYSDCDNDVIIDDKLQIINKIYNLRNDTLEERDHDYRTVILCKNVHIRILKECLKLKANISALDKHGNSFLHTAGDYITSLMHYDVAQEIPKSFIRKLVWKRNKFGLSPLHLIVERAQLEVKYRR